MVLNFPRFCGTERVELRSSRTYELHLGLPAEVRNLPPNPGLDHTLPVMRGTVKQPIYDDRGLGFISSPDSQKIFGRDAWLHRALCPWVEAENLERGDKVLFQVRLSSISSS